jgi:hypothetical protein
MFSQGARQAGAGIPAASSATQAQAIAVSRRPHEVLVRTFYELCEAIVVAVRHQCSDREGSDDANKGRYYRSAGIALHLRCGCPLCGCRRSPRAWGRRGDARTGHIYNGLRCLLCDPGIGRLPRKCSRRERSGDSERSKCTANDRPTKTESPMPCGARRMRRQHG